MLALRRALMLSVALNTALLATSIAAPEAEGHCQAEQEPPAVGHPGSALLQRHNLRALEAEAVESDDPTETTTGADIDTGSGTGERTTAHSLCPDDADDEAYDFWMKYFEEQCFVAEGDVPATLKKSLKRAEAVPDLHTTGGKVRCIVSAVSSQDGADLEFEAEEGADFQRNWKVVEGSAKLMVVRSGKMSSEDADKDTAYPGPCAIFPDTVPRTMKIETRILVDVFALYEQEYKKSCMMDIALINSDMIHMGRKEVISDAQIEWETYIRVAATTDSTVHLFYTVTDPSGAETLSLDTVQTDPKPCKLCGNCTTSPLLVEEDDGEVADVGETPESSMPAGRAARAKLAELRERRRRPGLSDQELEEVWEETEHWRQRLSEGRRDRNRSVVLKGRRGQGPSRLGRRPQKDEAENGSSFGDNFHWKVFPQRTVDDHKAVHALSEALVHLVSLEQGGEGLTQSTESNMIKNGGFEEGSSSPYESVRAGGSIGAWTVRTGTVEVGRFSNRYSLAKSGSSLVHLCGNGRGSIEQKVPTTAGTEYILSFSYAASPEGAGTQALSVSAAPGDKRTKFDFTESPSYTCSASRTHSCWAWRYMAWLQGKVRFTAQGVETTISFESLPGADTSKGCMVIDEVFMLLPPFHNLPSSYNFFADDGNTTTHCWKPPYDQEKCGSCWAFASVGALEKQYCLRTNGQSAPSLSREMLVRCSVRNNACGGGNADAAYGDLMEIGGLWQTKCLPYQGDGVKHCPAFAYSWTGQGAVGKTGKFARIDQEVQQNCDDFRRFNNRPPVGTEWDLPFTMIYAQRTGQLPNMSDPSLLSYRRYFSKARSHDNVPSWWLYGEDAMMAAILKYGALYASFKVYDDFKKRKCDDHCWPKGEIYGHDRYAARCGCGCSGHAIQVIGYGTEVLEDGEELKYWQIENSWGDKTQLDLFNGEPDDPFSYNHPENAEDKCVVSIGASSGGEGDGWELLFWVDNKLVLQKDIRAGTKELDMQETLDLVPGKHSITFEVHAKQHQKKHGFPTESYGLYRLLMRCRGRAFRYDFVKNFDQAQVSWNKATRAELIKRADELLRRNGIDTKTTVPACPSRCRQGRFSSTHPCTGILTTYGKCSHDDSYKKYQQFDCSPCDAEKALLMQKANLIHKLPSKVFQQWYTLIHEALRAPDPPGWARKTPFHCAIITAGHNNFTRLNATYTFDVPSRNFCDKRNSAMFKPTIPANPTAKLKVFMVPDDQISVSDSRTQPCPPPLGGQVTLECTAGGVLRVKTHSCIAQNNMDLTKRGYYRMLRGEDYHQIERGAAFAIAELGVSSNICPTKSWSQWTRCDAVGPCEKGTQRRSRVPRPPLTTNSPACAGVIFQESRPCSRPGFCPQVLTRFMKSSATTVQGFLSAYQTASTKLPAPTAGAHMLKSVYASCPDMQHWCALITGAKACTVLFQAQFQVAKAGRYMLRLDGSAIGDSSEVIFSPERGRKATERPHFKVKKGQDMQRWTDKMELHRRRRAGKGGMEWRTVGDAYFERGSHAAWVLVTGWNPCPKFTLKLKSRTKFSPAVVFGKSRSASSREFFGSGPWVSAYDGSKYKKGKLFGSNWTFSAEEMYRALGINQFDQALERSSITVKGQTMLPRPGLYKLEVRADVKCRPDQLWKYCDTQSRRRQSSIKLTTGEPRMEAQPYHRRRRSTLSNGHESVVVEHIVNASSAAPMEFEIYMNTRTTDAGKRVSVGSSSGVKRFESVPVPGRYVLPNSFSLVWSQYNSEGGGSTHSTDPEAIGLGSQIHYASDLELLHGEDLTRITWPDRDMPFATEYQIQPFEETPAGLILLGNGGMRSFFAEAVGRVDAGACVSLVCRAQDDFSKNGTFRGFGLQMCDVDGDRQFLELIRIRHGDQPDERLGWVHVEFQHPMHLVLVRDIPARRLKIGYRPDNRVHYATISREFQTQLNVSADWWNLDVEVGVSMGTERPYRWAEFYNVTIDRCAETCKAKDGKTLLCGGNITTSCGTTISCSAPCNAGESCVQNHCFACPPEKKEHVGWDCGHRQEICKDHEGKEFEKSVPVGRGCPDKFVCGPNHKCICTPETSYSLQAVGYECGSVSDGCGGNVTLPQCSYAGRENAKCIDNKCECTPRDFTSDQSLAVIEGWNCGAEPNGCGTTTVFGTLNGNCPAGKVCGDHVCCKAESYPLTYECGKAYDTCLKRWTTFTGGMEEWELVFRQTAPEGWWRSRWSSVGSKSSGNYAAKWSYQWSRSRVAKSYLSPDDQKFKLKLLYTGSKLPVGQEHYNVWKQLKFPPQEVCSRSTGPLPGYAPVEINFQVPDGFGGLCKDWAYGHLISGEPGARRRRVSIKTALGVRSASHGIVTPFKDAAGNVLYADKVELFVARIKDSSGACPTNKQCSTDHRCEAAETQWLR